MKNTKKQTDDIRTRNGNGDDQDGGTSCTVDFFYTCDNTSMPSVYSIVYDDLGASGADEMLPDVSDSHLSGQGSYYTLIISEALILQATLDYTGGAARMRISNDMGDTIHECDPGPASANLPLSLKRARTRWRSISAVNPISPCRSHSD